jgi:hypothetical protein
LLQSARIRVRDDTTSPCTSIRREVTSLASDDVIIFRSIASASSGGATGVVA